ncbi:DUF1697 domain-containing protein [Lacinutrix sp. C3R15]|uniref:DUF1697 domain-containing protein n=1 Tax=Flavobacteriaceae TaxID=49546 RepID=UPI001C088A8D|nr:MULTISPECIES: DUF1697 domain-containing protein [Flavobacteriaceae]MBU2939124.1 DUF1697 domain-containing protein [Lacinutrix sp. C3R15]MDO6622439.1 DUF1697 domain-containing protein [Oceanihabitans sp. 1_MG-2023]
MNTYIALLRGINVGGHKKIPMAALRELLIKTGFQNVQTYIQSGNVVLQSSEKNTKTIEAIIGEAITSYFQFEVAVLVKTKQELELIFKSCPFEEDKKVASYFLLLQETPEKNAVAIASKKEYKEEEFKIVNNCIYFYNPAGYGKSKFNANYFERTLKTPATARNYKTMKKLIDLIQ